MTDAPENRQYVACKYTIDDKRTYTFHNDGEPFADGDIVRVPARGGKGWKKVYVAAVGVPKPTNVETSAIIGRHVEVEPTPLEALALKAASAPEIARCKAAGIYNNVNGVCTTCERPEVDCGCLPF